jgi:hypothetical protein
MCQRAGSSLQSQRTRRHWVSRVGREEEEVRRRKGKEEKMISVGSARSGQKYDEVGSRLIGQAALFLLALAHELDLELAHKERELRGNSMT